MGKNTTRSIQGKNGEIIIIDTKAILFDEVKKDFKRILQEYSGRLDDWLEDDLSSHSLPEAKENHVMDFIEDYHEGSLSYLGFDILKFKAKIDFKGNALEIDENGCYSEIPDLCPECNCVQTTPNYKDFTNQTVHICEQCNEEISLQYS